MATGSDNLESGADAALSNTGLTEQLEKYFGKLAAEEFDWLLINPDVLERIRPIPRHALVDVGFMLHIGDRKIAITTEDNFFWLRQIAAPLDARFFNQHKCIELRDTTG